MFSVSQTVQTFARLFFSASHRHRHCFTDWAWPGLAPPRRWRAGRWSSTSGWSRWTWPERIFSNICQCQTEKLPSFSEGSFDRPPARRQLPPGLRPAVASTSEAASEAVTKSKVLPGHQILGPELGRPQTPGLRCQGWTCIAWEDLVLSKGACAGVGSGEGVRIGAGASLGAARIVVAVVVVVGAVADGWSLCRSRYARLPPRLSDPGRLFGSPGARNEARK